MYRSETLKDFLPMFERRTVYGLQFSVTNNIIFFHHRTGTTEIQIKIQISFFFFFAFIFKFKTIIYS